ncbi:MarR family winged helix-turn-helix transcriptional regulator [Acetobacter okinawensis]|uniref:MarR family winged helix-turn-helix transcriptional regulator n=1 Tax=Acetobacter okinawensis TaxID=1076594 RepID=UPI0039ECBC68
MSAETLSDLEKDAWRGFRRMAEIISGRIARDIARATGLSAADANVLMQLGKADDNCCRQRDIQDVLEWDKTRLSHQLTRMTGRGLIERSTGDEGQVVIRLTDMGRAQLDAAVPIHAAGIRTYFLDHLSPEDLIDLRAITGKLRASLFF